MLPGIDSGVMQIRQCTPLRLDRDPEVAFPTMILELEYRTRDLLSGEDAKVQDQLPYSCTCADYRLYKKLRTDSNRGQFKIF